ncbi:hypothetical protein [Algoriphagus limi]|uniref:EpsG family protein n=1 Tax=Algoriphagus limi TaxID=2975273 RepID=A0ABT2G174_9BACT|nr:hypothetical protein [Algoriphagus limi]MCS5489011.1 hypothetical protein [Algoriphagus limi]
MLAYIPALPTYLLLKSDSKKKFFMSVGFSATFLVFIYFSKIIIFDLNPNQSPFFYFGEKGQILFQPFAVWTYFSESPVLDILSSFFVLFLSVILFGKVLLQDLEFKFSSLIAIISILIYFLFAEGPERFLHSNFYWQIPISLFMLYVVMLKILLKEFEKEGVKGSKQLWKFKVVGLGYFLHILSGGYYLANYIKTGYFF